MTVGSQVKGCFSSVKSIESGLETLAAKTRNKEAEQAFYDAGKIVAEIKVDLQQQVFRLAHEEPQYK